jgi:hypothetical protein
MWNRNCRSGNSDAIDQYGIDASDPTSWINSIKYDRYRRSSTVLVSNTAGIATKRFISRQILGHSILEPCSMRMIYIRESNKFAAEGPARRDMTRVMFHSMAFPPILGEQERDEARRRRRAEI